MLKYSIIIPVYKEEQIVEDMMDRLESFEEKAEIIVVDGDSRGSTIEKITGRDAILLKDEKGRAGQMNRGAEMASGDVLLFLHADTELPSNAFEKIGQAIEAGYTAGAFKLKLSSRKILLRIISRGANIRVLFSKTPYGDQAIFIKRKIFDSAGGYPQIPLMEEVELMKKIKKEYGGIKIIKTPVKSSARRWEQHGIFKTTARNYLIYLLHSIKVSPDLLAKIYYGCSR